MIIGKKYEIIEKIGSGKFGTIYKGKNIRTNDYVAIKVEPIKNNTKLLKNETKVYQYLSSFNCNEIPKIRWFGVDDNNYYMVINLLGRSLLDIRENNKTFSLNLLLSIGINMIKIIRFIHEKGLLHRDIKPDNFLLGTNENKNKLYIIDFGLCKKYVNNYGEHIEIKKINNIIGTPSYISINIHNLLEPSRRDDLESIIYILLFLYYGSLDWSQLNINEENEKIKILKKNIIYKKEIPEIFVNLLNYIRNLEFKETPNYDYLIELCNIYK